MVECKDAGKGSCPSRTAVNLWTADYIRILFLNFLVGCTLFIQVSTLPSYILDLGGTKAFVGLSMGLFSFSALLTRPIAGILLDRIGRPRVMKGGSFFLVTTLLMYPVIKSLSFLLVLRSLNGIAFSLVSTSAITLVVDVTAESRLKAGIGYYAVSGTLASAVGPAVGMLILQKGDFLHLFLANGIMGLIVLSQGLYLSRKQCRSDRQDNSSGNPGEKERLAPAMFSPALLIIFLGLSLGLILTYIPVIGIERDIPDISLFFTFYALAIIGIRVLGSNLLEKTDPFISYVAAILFQCAALLIMAFSHRLFPVLAAALLYGFAFAIIQPLLNFMQIDVMPAGRKGLAGAVYFFALDTGFSSGSAGFGLLLEVTGFIPVFILCSIIVFSSIFLFKMIDARNRKEGGKD